MCRPKTNSCLSFSLHWTSNGTKLHIWYSNQTLVHFSSPYFFVKQASNHKLHSFLTLTLMKTVCFAQPDKRFVINQSSCLYLPPSLPEVLEANFLHGWPLRGCTLDILLTLHTFISFTKYKAEHRKNMRLSGSGWYWYVAKDVRYSSCTSL